MFFNRENMNSQLCPTPNTLCVACLSSSRKLKLINDSASKQTFTDFLDEMGLPDHPILLCYECTGRLRSAVCFKSQVERAHRCLLSCANGTELPTPMSKLEIGKTETFEYKPHLLNPQETFAVQPDTLLEEKTNLNDCNTSNNTTDNEMSDDNSKPFELDDDDNPFDFKHEKESKKLHNNRKSKSLVSRQSDNWEIKTENVQQKTENSLNFIKEEAVEEIECKEYDARNEIKYDFSDSDDEPLKAKRTQTKQVKKEGKKMKRERPAGVVSGVWVQKKLQQLNVSPSQLEMVVLSWEEVELERQKSLTNTKFTRHEFRCASCVVGFNHRFKLDTHMKKHSPEAGNLECSICKTRFKTQSALLCHRRRHRSRWRCSACGRLFSRAGVAADHHARAHGAAPPTHACHVCGARATSLGKLRVHLKNHAERQHCDQCGKSFRDKCSLRTHLYIHTNQKDFSCDVCDKRFRFKKALEIHRITHQASELLYCKDCDMNFKNRLSFYQHINYSMKHIHPDKIKYACEFCPRRFSKPARLEEHRLSIHLKLAPHRCTVDGCSFASASRSALRTHVRMVHRNKRLERNHVCHTCGKAYTTKKILEGHIRSHTGERPFVCTKCPATFSHDAALYNHNKLVHKTPFIRRRKPNQPLPEAPLAWPIGVVTTDGEGLPATDSKQSPNS